MRLLACLDEVPATDGTCVTEAWVEQAAPFPELTLAQGSEIATAALLAFAMVMAVKVALKKSQ